MGPVPDATTEKVADWPAVTDWFAGCELMEGAIAPPVPLDWITASGVDVLPITETLPEAFPATSGVKLNVHIAL
jgi:hypothetical protein